MDNDNNLRWFLHLPITLLHNSGMDVQNEGECSIFFNVYKSYSSEENERHRIPHASARIFYSPCKHSLHFISSSTLFDW